MEPYRALISDKLPKSQLARGFLTQSMFTGAGAGAVLANLSLFVFQKILGGTAATWPRLPICSGARSGSRPAAHRSSRPSPWRSRRRPGDLVGHRLVGGEHGAGGGLPRRHDHAQLDHDLLDDRLATRDKPLHLHRRTELYGAIILEPIAYKEGSTSRVYSKAS
jgi:hypothetical protein